jgi:hypothetical protein
VNRGVGGLAEPHRLSALGTTSSRRLAGYLWFRDIPPFVFYLLLLLVGLTTVSAGG